MTPPLLHRLSHRISAALRPSYTTLTRRAALSAAFYGAFALMALPKAAVAQDAEKVSVLTADAAFAAAQAGEIVLIDIRRPEEWAQTGVAEGAIGLDMTRDDFVDKLVALRMANPAQPLALICRTGNRTEYVTQALSQRGFPGLADVSEGMVGGPRGPGWLTRGLPTYEGTPENVAQRTDAVLP